MPRRSPRVEPLRSAAGVPLSREVAFVFALDPTLKQQRALLAHAGAARSAFNHHIARVKANLDQRSAERSYGIPDEQLTPALSWSKFSFINEFNAWKNGTAADSPVNPDGSRCLAWRGEVSADVFECASVDAQALANFSESRTGKRKGRPAAFPRFKTRHKTTPAFRLRNRVRPGQTQAIRVAGPKALLLPKLGRLRIHGCTRKLRRMLDAGRLHLCAASIRFARGRWWVTLTGLAAQFHPARRSPAGRHRTPAGLDRGVKSIAVVADNDGHVLRTLARAVADAGMGDLGRMLAYKTRWYGLKLIVADRWYASSKTCSGCGHVKDSLKLGERTYRCGHCGLVVDRDVNAAVNLARWPDRHNSPPLAAAA